MQIKYRVCQWCEKKTKKKNHLHEVLDYMKVIKIQNSFSKQNVIMKFISFLPLELVTSRHCPGSGSPEMNTRWIKHWSKKTWILYQEVKKMVQQQFFVNGMYSLATGYLVHKRPLCTIISCSLFFPIVSNFGSSWFTNKLQIKEKKEENI